jgi:hypothetical protein
MEKEITPEQALQHLFNLALEASVPAKVHNVSKQCFDVIKKLIGENVDVNSEKIVPTLQSVK